MKFKKTIEDNVGHFHDESFYDFLIEQADGFIKKEKKVISKAYNRGISDLITLIESHENLENIEPVKGIDYYNSKYDLKSFNEKFIEESELQSILESSDNIDDFKKKLRDVDLKLKVIENKEECKSCVPDENLVAKKIQVTSENEERVVKDSVGGFFKDVKENQTSSEPKSENREKQIEDAITRLFKESGVEIKSIKVIKL